MLRVEARTLNVEQICPLIDSEVVAFQVVIVQFVLCNNIVCIVLSLPPISEQGFFPGQRHTMTSCALT